LSALLSPPGNAALASLGLQLSTFSFFPSAAPQLSLRERAPLRRDQIPQRVGGIITSINTHPKNINYPCRCFAC
jgi:hypothetical protein